MIIKRKKIIALTLVGFILIALGIFSLLKDNNKLTAQEKKWLRDNEKRLVDIRIINNANTFGYNGEGIFFDYIKDFQSEYNLDINLITYDYGAITPGVAFKLSNTVSPEDEIFYKDHYVVVGKNSTIINNINNLNNRKIGVLNTDLSYVSYYLSHNQITFEQFNNLDLLFSGLNSLDYIIVPLNQTLDIILKNNYHINYHLSDINQFYYLGFTDDSPLNSILKKYYQIWKKDNFSLSYDKNLLKVFIRGLDYSEADMHTITSKVYNYGLVENEPYEIMSGEIYGGIIGKYVTDFSRISGIEFKYKKYNNYESLNKAINSNKVDLYFSNINLANQLASIDTGIDIPFVIITKNENDTIINSLESLKGKTVHILKDSVLHRYFNDLAIATVETYDNQKEIFNLAKKDGNVIILDEIYYEYNHNKFNKSFVKYRDVVKIYDASFRSNADEKFNKLLYNYVRSVDNNSMRYIGINEYNLLLNSNSLVSTIFKYILYLLLIGLVISLVVYRYTTRVKISNRIKKDDKMRFIDLLTSLKNRNYLNENISKWDQNNIYPQAAVIVDLNNIKFINDTYGYEEGDRQIKAAADILIKTQLDNSELIRTDGNEFLVYLVDYNEKQVSSYIYKLNKEFNNLPYEFGASIGFSMIENDLKLVDDAINEATLDMRKNKSIGAHNVEKD